MKLTKYRYTAMKKDGSKIVGTYKAYNRKEVLEYLFNNGFYPIYIDEIVPLLDFQKLKAISIGGIPLKEKVFLIKQFAIMLSAGVPIAQLLSILKEQAEYYPLKKILNEVYVDVSNGKSLSEGFRKFPELFDEITLSLIEAGEASGTLEKIFRKLSKDYTQRQKITSSFKNAMLYPAVVSFVILLVLSFIMLVIIPKISAVYFDFNLKLPLITKLLLLISETIVKYFYVYIILILTLIFLTFKWANSSSGKKLIDKFKLHIPILGKLHREYQVVIFTRVMYLMLDAGVPILKSIKLTEKSMTNFWFKLEIQELYDFVASGGKTSEFILNSRLFPKIVGYMFNVGEQSGKVTAVLRKLNQYYELEIMNVIKNLSTVIQPILILILGVIVGLIVVAIYLPLTQLATSIG